MARAFIGVGANLEPERNVPEALRWLAGRLQVVALSRFYRTAPLDRPGQPSFVNGAVEVLTSLEPLPLKALLNLIERGLGRVRTSDRSAARPIDLDLLLYEQLQLSSPRLTLPDPEVGQRAFLAVPLAELAPELPLPGTALTLGQNAERFAHHPMAALPELEVLLRRTWQGEPWLPSLPPMDQQKVQRIIRELLLELGEDPDREGLRRTPARVAASLEYLTSGYRQDAGQLINNALFLEPTSSLIVARDLEIYSLCEEHLLPFFGVCHIGYCASKRVFGLSKLARLADLYARRLQVQERLTEQIARVVFESVEAQGVGVVLEARHGCRPGAWHRAPVVTSSLLGSFRSSPSLRDEFLTIIARGKEGLRP